MYVVKQVGGVISAAPAAGRYPDGLDLPELAARVTEGLQSVNGGIHDLPVHCQAFDQVEHREVTVE